MKKGDYLARILRSPKTVFTLKDIALLWEEALTNAVRSRLDYYVKQGKLYHIRRGFYAKDKNYDRMELSVKIYTPSYISFETVLTKAGVVFQFYSQIFVASYLTRTIEVHGQQYVYRKIKDPILFQSKGIEVKTNYHIASPERAFLDVVYLNKDYYFDNLSQLNWDRIFEILPIYQNKRMERSVREYYKHFQAAA